MFYLIMRLKRDINRVGKQFFKCIWTIMQFNASSMQFNTNIKFKIFVIRVTLSWY